MCTSGGALWEGDIEDLPDGTSCLRCPRHGRLIELDSGAVRGSNHEGNLMLHDTDNNNYRNRSVPPQRTHWVEKVSNSKVCAFCKHQ